MIHSQLEVVFFTTYARSSYIRLDSEFNHRLISKENQTGSALRVNGGNHATYSLVTFCYLFKHFSNSLLVS